MSGPEDNQRGQGAEPEHVAVQLPGGEQRELEIVQPVAGHPALISAPLTAAGYNMYDPGFAGTAAYRSSITFIDGDKGVLLYRGYPASDVSRHRTFLETALLLANGEFPSAAEVAELEQAIKEIGPALFEKVAPLFEAFSPDLHPMGMLSASLGALSAYTDGDLSRRVAGIPLSGVQLLAVGPFLTAQALATREGHGMTAPDPALGYVENFLRICLGHKLLRDPAVDRVDPLIVRALETLFILHADHEQNCSTATLRMVGSSNAGFFPAASAAVSALWGPLHGGANEAVIQMLEQIHTDGNDLGKYVARAKDKADPFRLMGFGHRVYKTTDARAKVLRDVALDVVGKLAADDPLLGLAVQLEELALTDEYFITRKLYPNVDFYSGLIYRAIGFPAEMFTPLFFIGRAPGWAAHWLEWGTDPERKIGRPAQIYTGPAPRELPAD